MNLSVDGKHSGSVQSDDPAAVTEGLLWAKKTWGQLVRLPGKSFHGLTHEGLEQADTTDNTGGPPPAAEPDPADEAPPICSVHQVPMVRVNGRKGPFWSCHEQLADGRWCSYRPR